MSGEWGGVMGNVVLGNYPLSLNKWTHYSVRFNVLDLVPILKDEHSAKGLFTIPKPTMRDFGFFTRPFSIKVWICLSLVIGVSSLIIFGLNLCQISEGKIGFQGIIFSLSVLFTVMYAYYGGALTMFLMTENEDIFSNLDEALYLFPEYKVMLRDGLQDRFWALNQRVITITLPSSDVVRDPKPRNPRGTSPNV